MKSLLFKFIGIISGTGITLGRNVAVRFLGDTDYDRYLLQHETRHLSQINDMEAVKFYLRNIFP